MSPSEIRDATLSQLRAARTAMMSARWTLSLEDKDKETKEEAAKQLLQVHHTIQKLENTELSGIRDKLLENDGELAKGREALENALKSLNKTKEVLGAVDSLLKIVARVVPLLL